MNWGAAFPFQAGDALVMSARLGPIGRLGATARVLAVGPVLRLSYDFPTQTVLMKRLEAAAGEVELHPGAGQLIIRPHDDEATEAPLAITQEDGSMSLRIGDDPRVVGLTLMALGPARAQLRLSQGLPMPLRGLLVDLQRG